MQKARKARGSSDRFYVRERSTVKNQMFKISTELRSEDRTSVLPLSTFVYNAEETPGLALPPQVVWGGTRGIVIYLSFLSQVKPMTVTTVFDTSVSRSGLATP